MTVVEAENPGFLDAALQPDGKIIVVGQFTNYNATFAPCIVRLHPNGSLDSTFNPGLGPQWVTTSQISSNYFARIEAVKILPDNKILIAGNFEAFNGFPYNSVARLHPDGSVDDTFFCGLERRDLGLHARSPGQLIAQPDGNFLVTGQFTRAGESDAIRLWRLLLRPGLSISRSSPDEFRVSLRGGADRAYTVQTSADLVNWQIVTTLTNTNDEVRFIDSPGPGKSQRFYRAVRP